MEKIKYFKYIGVLLIGLLIGKFLLGNSTEPKAETHSHSDESTVWTCSMDPQIRQNEPGKCPLCGMDLIPLVSSSTNDNPYLLQLPKEAVSRANIQTTKVSLGKAIKKISLNGKIAIDERKIQTQAAHFMGRIENLNINFTGEYVKKGQLIGTYYSPDLVNAQKEYLELLKTPNVSEDFIKSAYKKLQLLKLTDKQIKEIEQQKTVIENFPILSEVSGFVMELMAKQGDYMMAGGKLFDVYDLSSVWVLFDVYEADISFIKEGSVINFVVSSFPDKSFKGTVKYIDPMMNEMTRTLKVRAEVNNPGNLLKPEMFTKGTLESSISSKNEIIIPNSSVMWTGKRSIVYLEVPETDIPTYELKEIELGQSLGDFYIVKNGLNEGDNIVTHGTYTIDAAAQLNNKMSMMNKVTSIKGEIKEVKLPNFKNDKTKSFSSNLENAIMHYINLKDEYVKSSSTQTQTILTQLISSIQKIEGKSLTTDEAKKYWEDKKKILLLHLEAVKSSSNLEDQRKNFTPLSDQFIEVLTVFGTSKTYFHQYCPMANDYTGGSWISAEKAIKNPYFGDQMLTCGSVKMTFGE